MCRTFDATPIRRLLQARAEQHQVSLIEIGTTLGLPARTLARALSRPQLRWDTADRLAVALGHHPAEIWPSWYGHLEEQA